MWVADSLDAGERVARRLPVVDRRCTGEHRVNRRGNEFDVTELLGGDVGDQVVERSSALPTAEVERLKRVVEESGHLSEATTHQLLDGCGASRVGVGGRRQLEGDAVNAKNHQKPPGSERRSRTQADAPETRQADPRHLSTMGALSSQDERAQVIASRADDPQAVRNATRLLLSRVAILSRRRVSSRRRGCRRGR
jgi:hypothetical protein